ncbi:unnamed protein product, partial [Vitis vinifera]
MLQRAASNAYSWWWASHIRTKQSKWLEQHLQDMEEKVQNMLKLIQEDGDSFAKRAEMYYKRRPELINFVEETYKSYRALAERYDKISTELQNANNTLASIFPEQVQFAMDEDDEDCTPQCRKECRELSQSNAPQVPKAPGKKDVKGLLTLATKKLQQKKIKAAAPAVPKSGLTKPEALKEIDRLQKGILALQTEKEFVKSSYEIGLAKYWEIEKQITEMQEKNSRLQDEFNASLAIEDEDARNLMATTALRSCQMTLDNLQKTQEETVEEVKMGRQRITEAREKLDSFKNNQEKPCDNHKSTGAEETLESLDEEMKEQFEMGLNPSLTMTEMAEKIDELVNKVISLQTVVSSQTALVKRLRTETGELQTKIESMEDDKDTLTGSVKNLGHNLRELEKKLHGIQDPNQNVESRNNNLQTHFTEAHRNLDQLFETLQKKLHNMRQGKDEKGKPEETVSRSEAKSDPDNHSEKCQEQKTEQEDEPNWKQLFLDGMKDREKTLLAEYTAILKNYKEVKQKLSEVEKKTTVQVKELESANAKKDEDIQSLHQESSLLRVNLDEEKDLRKSKDSDHQPASTLSAQPMSMTEERFRTNIDTLLEENLNFWLRFSTSVHQIQKFQTEVEDLQTEISKLKEKQNALLKEELQQRFSSLCNIQEDISRTLKEGPGDEEIKFTSYQAAKLQGEVMNMQQENNKVAGELQAGLDHVRGLQTKVEKTLTKLNEEFGLAGSKNNNHIQLTHSTSRGRVPLQSFIFGVKPKKQKPSIFSCMNPSLHRKYHHMKAGLPM